MYQRKLGTDDREHEFLGVRLQDSKHTQGDIKKITARKTGTRTLGTFTKLNKTSTSEDKAI